MSTTTTSLRVPVDLLAVFDQLAETLGRNRSALMLEALKDFADRESHWQAEMTARVAAADQGDFVPEEEMADWWATHSTPEARAHARVELARESGLPE